MLEETFPEKSNKRNPNFKIPVDPKFKPINDKQGFAGIKMTFPCITYK